MPKVGSGDVLDDTSIHLPDDIGQFRLTDVIAGPLNVNPTPTRKFKVEGYEKLVELFNRVKDLD